MVGPVSQDKAGPSSGSANTAGAHEATAAAAPSRGLGCGGALLGTVVAALILAAAAGGWFASQLSAPPTVTTTVVKAGPPVLLAVRDLARLQTAEFRMERVIDLRDKQKRLWGLLESEDAILLVASARVTAGVDLRQLDERDVQADFAAKRVTITLPPVEIFEAALDNDRTYVHRRDTDLLADRQNTLETRARQQAEKHLIEAAREAGLVDTAQRNAKQTVEGLLHSLGFERVTVKFRR